MTEEGSKQYTVDKITLNGVVVLLQKAAELFNGLIHKGKPINIGVWPRPSLETIPELFPENAVWKRELETITSMVLLGGDDEERSLIF